MLLFYFFTNSQRRSMHFSNHYTNTYALQRTWRLFNCSNLNDFGIQRYDIPTSRRRFHGSPAFKYQVPPPYHDVCGVYNLETKFQHAKCCQQQQKTILCELKHWFKMIGGPNFVIWLWNIFSRSGKLSSRQYRWVQKAIDWRTIDSQSRFSKRRWDKCINVDFNDGRKLHSNAGCMQCFTIFALKIVD